MRITKENLTRYDQHFKSWHRRRLGYGNALENWHQTEEAGAVAFYPVGGSPLEGKVKFSFTETPPASGDKGPENPSTITGVSSVKVTRCGKNLIPIPYDGQSGTISGVSFTVNNDGTVLVNGTASNKTVFVLNRYIRFNKNIQYFLSGRPNASDSSFSINVDFRRTYTTGYFQTISDIGNGKAYTPSIDCYGSPYISIPSGVIISNLVFRPQLELGADATAFEPYSGADYTLPLGSTYYGGTLDVATGVMTVTHKHLVLDGTEPVSRGGSSDSNYYWYIDILYPQILYSLDFTTTHFGIATEYTDHGMASYININGVRFGWRHADYSLWGSADAVKSFLSSQYSNGTPLSIVYGLAEPLTVQLDPVSISALAQTSRHEPRINTVYTDADSIQITYQKSPIRAATEQEMAILGLGGNV